MAIPFLNNINLSDNQLLNAKLQITGTAPAAEQGQIYFNSATGFLKPRVHDGSAWLNLLDTTSIINGTYITSTVTNDVDLTLDLSAVDGTSVAGTRFLSKDNTWDVISDQIIIRKATATEKGTVELFSNTIQTVAATAVSTTAARTYGIQFNAADQMVVNVPWTDTNVVTYTIDVPTGTTNINLKGSDSTDDPITLSGTSGQTVTSRIDASEIRVALQDSVTILNDLSLTEGNFVVSDNGNAAKGNLTVAKTGTFGGQVTIPQVPVSDTDAASKHYVDQAVTGALSYQGAYNAATNTPDLDSSPSSTIKTGWTYTVTVEGLFFTEQVRVGDVLIANNNAPTTLAEWTTVQNNIDLADATTVGIGNVVPGSSNTITAPYTSGTAALDVVDSTASQKGAVIVAPGAAVDVSYASGTATVSVEDSTASNKGAIIVSGGTGIDVAYASGTATVSLGAQSSLTFTNTGPASAGTTYEISAATHGLGADSSIIMVQLVEVSSGETVYTDVVRGASGLITMTFAASQAINTFRALLQKIG